MPTDLPLLHRADLLREQLARLPIGSARPAAAPPPVRLGKTGTGEDLLVLAWTAAELAHEVAAGARLFRALGVAPGMRVANALPGALATPGALLLGDVVEAIGALDVPLGAIDGPAVAQGAWELVDRVRPAVLVLTEASAGVLFTHAPAADRPWWQGIVWLRSSEFAPSPRPTPPAGFAGWQRTWLAVPEVASFVAHECPRGALHLDADVQAEVSDAGLVLTPAGDRSPRWRYQSGLTATVTRCDCSTPGATFRV